MLNLYACFKTVNGETKSSRTELVIVALNSRVPDPESEFICQPGKRGMAEQGQGTQGRRVGFFFFFFIALGLEWNDTKIYEP